MRPFTYERAGRRPAAAVQAAGQPGAKFIAGGTNLLDLMKLEIERRRIWSTSPACRWREIADDADGGLRIGALVRNSDLAADPRGARSAIRCWRRRCWPAPRASCATRRRPAATCCSARAAPTSTTPPCPATSASRAAAARALAGFNRMHAMLGASDACIAVHPSDMAVAMAALRRARSRRCSRRPAARTIPIAELPPPARRHPADARPPSAPAS